MKNALLLIHDDETVRSHADYVLSGDYDLQTASNRHDAIKIARRYRPIVVLLDLGLPPSPADSAESLATLSDLLDLDPFVKIIVLTDLSQKIHAIKAIGEGAYDFLFKPVDTDELKRILVRAFHMAALEREYRSLSEHSPIESFEGMIGSSPPMRELFTRIRKVAATDAPVLVLGESGTGKEMTALALHRRSKRKHGPFIPINCGAIPPTLLESELFGHERGSFTGAHSARRGRIETAAGGTLLLDEIGELPPALQVKILRFLQDQTIERVGGRTRIKIDTRIIAATNTDLQTAMSEGTFRKDLYYRLAVVVLQLPALRDRAGDIVRLAQSFLHESASAHRRRVTRFTPHAIHALLHHPWPGNVRELQNRICRAVIMAEGGKVTIADLELADLMPPATPAPMTLREVRETAERAVVKDALLRHNNKIAPAAAQLGISRPTLYELMEKLGLRKTEIGRTCG